tara:strand:+ start:34 stop:825 length:792 start_codon:yes stop_codon:yes gene_type:complete
MKKYLVIGNPIDHSLSPKLHNFWIKKNKIDAIYEKKLINENNLEEIISKIRKGDIHGINVTLPFKKSIIPFIDELSIEANNSQSVNTVYKKKDKIIGHNTDIAGFELGLRHCKYDVKGKKILILGAGGVVSSIILALKKMGSAKIILSNRTKEKAQKLKKIFLDIETIEWGDSTEFDMIINATSLGLNKNDEIKLNYIEDQSNKFFYDTIYNPKETNFLKNAKKLGNKIENGKMMFIYQAHQSFSIWHKILPVIDDETIKLLD